MGAHGKEAMDRSDTPTLLIPLLALLAIVFPFTFNHRSAAPASQTSSQPSPASILRQNKKLQETLGSLRPHSAARLIEDFLHARSDPGGSPVGDPRSSYSLDFMIATVPDPVDSRLPQMFDAAIDSIQRAFEADRYVLDRFDLAWSEPASESANSSSSPAAEPQVPRYRREPSLLLFRQPADPDNGQIEGRLLLVFLVGETPTSGLQKAAMASALVQLANFFPWGPGPDKPPAELCALAQKNPGRTIRILGPTFSGSAESLDFELRDWLDKVREPVARLGKLPRNFRIVSGTATAVHPQDFSPFADGRHPGFQAVVPPDNAAMEAILGYIRRLGREISYRRVAMLTEGGTVYGQNQEYVPNQTSSSRRAARRPGAAELQPEVINLPFPLHISQLRAATEKQRQSQQKSATETITNPSTAIPLDEGETSQPKETPPSFSSLEVSSADLVLTGLLSTISREGIHAVGILATDVRDTIFLAREIHQHCPGTLVFTVASDLLYSHPDVGDSARGMLVFTPYPAFNLDQVWTPPFWGVKSRSQFSGQDAEGVYNATLVLLGRDDLLLDYGEPFGHGCPPQMPDCVKPELWVTAVGRNGPMPVTTLAWKDPADYSLGIKQNSQIAPPTLNEQGIYTSGSALGIGWICLFLAGLGSLLIYRYRAPGKLEQEDGSGWPSRLFGEPVNPQYRAQARLFLLASLVCLFAADVVLTAVYSLPAVAAWRLGTLPPVTDLKWLAGLAMVSCFALASLMALAGAVVVVGVAFCKVPRPRHFLQKTVTAVVLAACVIALVLAPRLGFVWLQTAWQNPVEGIATHLRTFEFLRGLSPLVPLVCVALAGFLWAFCSFWRLRMIDGIRPTSRASSRDAHILGVSTESFKGVADLESKVRERLENASAFPTNWHILVISVGFLLFVWIYLFVFPFVPSYEGLSFYFLFSWGFFLVYFALTTEFSRLWMVWSAFRRLLQRLASLPMQAAYGRFHVNFPGLSRIDLAIPLESLTVLSNSVHQAGQLLQVALSLRSSGALSGADCQSFENWASLGRDAVPEAERSLAQALEADANGKWRLAVEKMSQCQEALGRLTHATAVILEPLWRRAKNAASPAQSPPELQMFRELGEEFLVGRVVLLITYVLPSLRKLGTFVLSGLLLMLFSVMFYPFLQKNQFLAFNWFVILSFVGLSLLVMLQMERDSILNLLNGTEPGQVTVTRHFTFRILKYVMVPILLLLSAQFPDTLGQIISWFSTTQGH